MIALGINLAIVVGACALLWMARGIQNPQMDPLGPAFFPSIVLAGIIVFGLIAFGRDVWNQLHRQAGPRAAAPRPAFRLDEDRLIKLRPFAVVALLTAYIWALNAGINFEIVSGLLLFATTLLFTGFTRKRLIFLGLVVAVVLPPVTGYLFKTYFFLNLP